MLEKKEDDSCFLTKEIIIGEQGIELKPLKRNVPWDYVHGKKEQLADAKTIKSDGVKKQPSITDLIHKILEIHKKKIGATLLDGIVFQLGGYEAYTGEDGNTHHRNNYNLYAVEKYWVEHYLKLVNKC